jgi:hypothetical protein
MIQVNDARFAALRGLGFTGAINDMTLAWLQSQLPAPIAATNLIANPELAGGADSGPVDGNNPPTGWTIGFNTATSVPVDIGGGFFAWIQNQEEANARCPLQRDIAADLAGAEAGDIYLFQVSIGNPTDTNYSAALSIANLTGGTIIDSYTRAAPQSTQTCYAIIAIDDPVGLVISMRMGVGTTANNTVSLNVSNPRLYDYKAIQNKPYASLADAWHAFLAQEVPAATGHWNDDWFAYLGSLGFTGSLNDRELAFWNGLIP